ncbi:hypothetical protein KBY96_14120 [Cyanobium sp. ATX 6A2]|jgi:hypothetical protein|uniref:hypothetical protein n=1 Tax=Cyanobium sp. ATX 6A2 TaxID=2823700 RepID=UPI0020CDC742|nr:hypothetical protein [Cyanobium sp. ATX 6A2]MCP9889059.1 hypothetical protein [Cyanobium sp. ATX 6A2]
MIESDAPSKSSPGIILVANSLIQSFSTTEALALLKLAPWSISAKASIRDASDRLKQTPVNMLIVVDPESGKVPALITGNAEVAAFGKKKKPDWIADQFIACHQRCHAECSRRGGCGGYALVVTSESLSIQCHHWCKDDSGGPQIPIIQDLLTGLG